MSVCTIVGCRKMVCISKVTNLPTKMCQDHRDIHASRNRISSLRRAQKMQQLREQANAYDELVRTVQTLSEELRASKAENEKLRKRKNTN